MTNNESEYSNEMLLSEQLTYGLFQQVPNKFKSQRIIVEVSGIEPTQKSQVDDKTPQTLQEMIKHVTESIKVQYQICHAEDRRSR